MNFFDQLANRLAAFTLLLCCCLYGAHHAHLEDETKLFFAGALYWSAGCFFLVMIMALIHTYFLKARG